jgi:ABC-2 type transport system permease protein
MNDKIKSKNPALIIMSREIKSYFSSPIAYIVTGLFVAACAFLFVNTFFLANRAELRGFFSQLPVLYSFFIPALTMRMFAEEKRSTSLETLLTLPVTVRDIVLGKYLAAFISGAILLVPSLFYALTCAVFGIPDAGPMIGGYLGSLFLTATFCAIGLYASSITKNQIIAFFTGFAICIMLTLFNYLALFMPSFLVRPVTYLSAINHFQSISRGIIDTRDIVYFVSLSALFIVMTVRSVKGGQE